MDAIAGRYRVEHVVGRGAMATVYAARDETLGRRVAVKVLADDVAADEQLATRFLREARVAAQLAHPNVVRVFDAGADGGRAYLVMEFVGGESLAERLRRERRLRADETAALGAQAAAGLAHAHAAGVVHRDVKPANLLLDGDGTVKIADFGIARAAGATQLTAQGTLLGTAAYLAPEQAAGGDATPASDAYSLGVVLYECLAGRPPHRIATLADLAAAHAGAPTPLRDVAPETPEWLEDVVMRCLARTPEFRPATAELATLLARDDEANAPTRPFAQRPRRRRAPWIAAAALVGATAIAAGVVAATHDSTSTKPSRTRPFAPEPVARGSSAADEARNLAAWLRRYASR